MTTDIAAMTTTKVYSYLRFSSKRQEKGQSIERQSNAAELWAREHGYVLDTALSMSDHGLSAYHQRHVKNGALGVFLKAVEDGMVTRGSVLIVEQLDRLSRADPIDAQAQLTNIINAGVTVVTVMDKKAYSRESLKANPMDLILSLLIMIRANEESETKSKRAKDAIESKCRRWIDGSFRGRIVCGNDPSWVRWNGSAFELVEPEASKWRRIAQLQLQGYGAYRIAQTLVAEGLEAASKVQSRSYKGISESLRSAAHLLIGTRIVNNKGTEFRLENYYPALIDEHAYNEIVSNYNKPKGHGRAAEAPSIFTGHNGLFRCGYCGGPLSIDRERNTNKYIAGMRRARCNNHNGCRSGACMLAPLERAVLAWCSDQMNLNSLVGADRSTEVKNRLAAARASVGEMKKQLDRIADALLSSDSPPAIFADRARKIEGQISAAQHSIRADEATLLAESHTPTTQAADVWQSLAAGVMNDDVAARMAVRKLVGDTFKSVVLYRHGTMPPPVEETRFKRDKEWQLLLVSKSGVSRLLRISRDGEVLEIVDEDCRLSA